jgi:hypothetical protein
MFTLFTVRPNSARKAASNETIFLWKPPPPCKGDLSSSGWPTPCCDCFGRPSLSYHCDFSRPIERCHERLCRLIEENDVEHVIAPVAIRIWSTSSDTECEINVLVT